jgi:uncharacterized protein YdaU (DUF1376 family)
MNYYRFFPEKYRLKTRHLNPYQDGCYRRLIDEYMNTRAPLPDDDEALAGVCRISLDDWHKLASSKLRAFFTPKNGLLFQENCDAELDWQDNVSKIRTEKAKKGAAARHNKINNLDATSKHQALLGDARVKSKEERKEKHEECFLKENHENDGTENDGTKNGKRKLSKSKLIPMPDDWQLSIKHFAKCSELEFNADELAEQFTNYHKSKGNCFASWDAAFSNWIGNAKKYREKDEQIRADKNGRTQDVVGAAFRARAAHDKR